MSENAQDLADKILKKILDDDERKHPRFGRQNFEKILDDDERNAQDLADKILKKFCMTMSEHSERKEKQK